MKGREIGEAGRPRREGAKGEMQGRRAVGGSIRWRLDFLSRRTRPSGLVLSAIRAQHAQSHAPARWGSGARPARACSEGWQQSQPASSSPGAAAPKRDGQGGATNVVDSGGHLRGLLQLLPLMRAGTQQGTVGTLAQQCSQPVTALLHHLHTSGKAGSNLAADSKPCLCCDAASVLRSWQRCVTRRS